MTSNSPDRLDRIERMLEGLIRVQDNQQQTVSKQQESIQILIDGQLSLQAQMGLLSETVLEVREEARQIKRAVDYLLSRDGERGMASEN